MEIRDTANGTRIELANESFMICKDKMTYRLNDTLYVCESTLPEGSEDVYFKRLRQSEMCGTLAPMKLIFTDLNLIAIPYSLND